MASDAWIESLLPGVMDKLAECRRCPAGANTERGMNLAGKRAVCSVLDDIVSILFPGCHAHEPVSARHLEDDLEHLLRITALTLQGQIHRALEYQCTVDKCKECGDCEERATAAVQHLMGRLPAIQAVLQHDITAAYEGDPAARSTMEVVMSYPGVYAIIVHRVAHVLYEENVPLIPRIMGEHAHSLTGIDIHPGATIGPGFFIDHGTGVVIGETSRIGNNVRIYQGVTLGAQSLPTDTLDQIRDSGQQRHPTIEDNVTIYPDATILGGHTRVGKNAVVGGNVWLVRSVKPGTTVLAPVSVTMLRPCKKLKISASAPSKKTETPVRKIAKKKKNKKRS